jgi:hypothetical protein
MLPPGGLGPWACHAAPWRLPYQLQSLLPRAAVVSYVGVRHEQVQAREGWGCSVLVAFVVMLNRDERRRMPMSHVWE